MHRQQLNRVDQIREVFYNAIANQAYDADINRENIDAHLKIFIERFIHNILKNSDLKHVQFAPNITLTVSTCPLVFIPLCHAILNIKISSTNSPINIINQKVQELAQKITLLEAFKEIIPKVKSFIYDIKGIVTTDDIREAFYNFMSDQCAEALLKEWITQDELEDEEPFLYFALPALALLEVTRQSERLEGFRLRSKILNKNNCPHEEDFFTLFNLLSPHKDKILKVAENEIQWQALNYMCFQKENNMPEELQKAKTPLVRECSAHINELSSLISRREIFKEKIDDVIKKFVPRKDVLPHP